MVGTFPPDLSIPVLHCGDTPHPRARPSRARCAQAGPTQAPCTLAGPLPADLNRFFQATINPAPAGKSSTTLALMAAIDTVIAGEFLGISLQRQRSPSRVRGSFRRIFLHPAAVAILALAGKSFAPVWRKIYLARQQAVTTACLPYSVTLESAGNILAPPPLAPAPEGYSDASSLPVTSTTRGTSILAQPWGTGGPHFLPDWLLPSERTQVIAGWTRQVHGAPCLLYISLHTRFFSRLFLMMTWDRVGVISQLQLHGDDHRLLRVTLH